MPASTLVPAARVGPDQACRAACSRLSSLTGWKQRRGPSAVERNVSSHGNVIIWLKGMPGVAIWPQPIWMRRPSRGRDVTIGLGGVEGVAAMAGQLGGLGSELMAVECAEHVFAAAGGEHPELPGRLAVHRQLKEVRALEEALDAALELPLLQVGRGVEGDPAFAVQFVIDGHDPAFARGCATAGAGRGLGAEPRGRR